MSNGLDNEDDDCVVELLVLLLAPAEEGGEEKEGWGSVSEEAREKGCGVDDV